MSATLVLGGARSGKSAFAEQLAIESGLERIYIATSQVYDDEMRKRVDEHKARRAKNTKGWTTFEEPLKLAEVLQTQAKPDAVILVDCLTLWLTNLMLDEALDTQSEMDALLAAIPFAGPVIFVSNEVGLGIVPENKLAREFRDFAGTLHQQLAAKADRVTLVTAGLPQNLKGS